MDYERTTEKETVTKEKVTEKETVTKQAPATGCDQANGTIRIDSSDQHLRLMELYLSEWEHRDNMLWKQAFTYFIFTFAIAVFPFACPWIMKDESINEIMAQIPQWLFPAVGMGLSLIFIFIMLGYARRLKFAGNIYRAIIQMLPKELQEERLQKQKSLKETPKDEKWNYILGISMASFITVIMFGILLAFSLFLLIISLKK